MPQIISACKERNDIGKYLPLWKNDLHNSEVLHESSTEPKFVSPTTNHSVESFCNPVTENGSCDSRFGTGCDEEDRFKSVTENDSGFGTGSDEEDRFNSGSSSEDSYPNNIMAPASFLNIPGLFNTNEKTSTKENDIKHQCIQKSVEKYVNFNKTPNHCDDGKYCFNSGLSSQIRLEDCDSNTLSASGFELDTPESFDFWNKTSIQKNNINHQCNRKSVIESSIINSTSNCSNYNTHTDTTFGDAESFLSLLSEKIIDKHSDSENKSLPPNENHVKPTQHKQETANDNDSELDFYHLLNSINSDKDIKMVNPVSVQNESKSKHVKNIAPLSDDCSILMSNFFSNSNDTNSNLFYSCVNTCCDDSSKLNNATHNGNNGLNLDEYKNSKKSSNNSFLNENDGSLSDLLASICVESNIEEGGKTSFAETLSNDTGLMNDIETNEISLSSLAEIYLSSGDAKKNSYTSLKDDYLYLSENISLNLEGNLKMKLDKENHKELCDMCDLLPIMNKKPDNPDINKDLTTKSDSINVESNILDSSDINEVALFAKSYVYNDESSEDEIDGNTEIDLTLCLKSDKPSNSPLKDLSVPNDKTLQNTYPAVSQFHSSPTLLKKEASETYAPLLKSKRTKSKQSLFAKALSCKPKKEKSAILKVLNVQNQFCESLFNPPQQVFNIKPIKSNVCPANDFIFSTVGRRMFEKGKSREVK